VKGLEAMSNLERIERQIDDHVATDCQLCRNAINRVDAPGCPFLLELNREAREAYRKASPRVRYHAAVNRQ
jgi:hypothetical protein